jgi:phosphoglycerate dehydrogenase-like enzyme
VVELRVAVCPEPMAFAVEAVREGGGVVSPVDEADALIWLDGSRIDDLGELLDDAPQVDWVQLPFAGVEQVAAAGLFDDHRTWTCAKGSYAEPVAEHALALALAGMRDLDQRVRAETWGEESGISLFDTSVTILGGGGITGALLGLLAPFRVTATVVRRSAEPFPGAAVTLPTSELARALPGAAVVFLALALTPENTGIIAAPELALMDPTAWLVNVARGGHVVTDDLVAALEAGTIGGAALDVTDPEPLPDGHPLWRAPRAIITPHTADTWDMITPLLADRIRTNVAHRAADEPLEGLVDGAAGY